MRLGRAARLLAASALAAATVAGAAAPAGASTSDLARARAGTARYHQIERAHAAGYGLLTDAAGIACIDKPGEGGMGIHQVNPALVGDDKLDVANPELLVYEPRPNGRMQLVAAEYVVFQSAWDATHSRAPRLFGRELELVGEGNRYGLPPFYELHAWLWKHNPSGMFSDWNPRVICR